MSFRIFVTRKRSFFILAFGMFIRGTLAFAESPEIGKFALGLTGGCDYIAISDTDFAPVTSGSENNLGEEFGLEVKYRFADHWAVGFDANYLNMGSRSITQSYPAVYIYDPFPELVQPADTSTYTGTLDATEYLLSGAYIFPSVFRSLDLNLGLDFGVAMAREINTGSSTSSFFAFGNYTETYEDMALDAKIFLGCDYYFNRSVSLGLSLGYRYIPVFLDWKGPVDLDGFASTLSLDWWI
ncbi:MAG TPA: hypothetical protein VK914_10380 [bacterium]|jgi:hypothetical protein|nr:hypothetical protein [bacterium]